MIYQDLEDKIIARLEAEVPKLKSVEAYAGQLDQKIEQLAVRTPSAFVSEVDSKYSWVNGAAYEQKPEVAVLVVQRVKPSTGKVNRGILEGVIEALTHQTFGLGMERLMPSRSTLLFTNSLIEVRDIRFQCSFDRDFSE